MSYKRPSPHPVSENERELANKIRIEETRLKQTHRDINKYFDYTLIFDFWGVLSLGYVGYNSNQNQDLFYLDLIAASVCVVGLVYSISKYYFSNKEYDQIEKIKLGLEKELEEYRKDH